VLGGFIKNDLRTLAPQAGFAWDIKGNGKTVIRAGGGLFFETNIIKNFLFDRVLNLPPGLGNDTPVLNSRSALLLDPATAACWFNAKSFRPTAGQCQPGGINLFGSGNGRTPLRDAIIPAQIMQNTLQSVTSALHFPPPGVPPLFDQILTTEGGVIYNK